MVHVDPAQRGANLLGASYERFVAAALRAQGATVLSTSAGGVDLGLPVVMAENPGGGFKGSSH